MQSYDRRTQIATYKDEDFGSARETARYRGTCLRGRSGKDAPRPHDGGATFATKVASVTRPTDIPDAKIFFLA